MSGVATPRRGRLLFVVTEDWYFVSHRLQLAVAAVKEGYQVIVATNLRAHERTIRNSGITPISFPNSRTSINPLVEIRTLWRLIGIYRHVRPDIVHHVALKPVLYGSIAAWITRIPRVVNAVAGLGWLATPSRGAAAALRALARRLIAGALHRGTVIVQNEDDARYLSALGVPMSSVRRIPGAGVDLERFRPLPEPPSPPVIVFPARLLWAKGVGEFVEAARSLRERGVQATFAIAGEPDTSNRDHVPKDVLRGWTAENVIVHLGWVDDVPTLLANCHIVCLPTYYGEGIPKCLIEAAAAGRPIITTNTPGCREIVLDGRNGILVPPHDTAQLTAALQRLIDDPALRRRMGAYSREHASCAFGLQTIVRQTLDVYREIFTSQVA